MCSVIIVWVIVLADNITLTKQKGTLVILKRNTFETNSKHTFKKVHNNVKLKYLLWNAFQSMFYGSKDLKYNYFDVMTHCSTCKDL